MLGLNFQNIYFYNEPVDMRKSFNSLSNLVSHKFTDKLLSGDPFVFINKRKNIIKILYWHGDGFVIWNKRLEQGTFLVSWNGKTLLTRREFMMLLEGIAATKINHRFSFKKE